MRLRAFILAAGRGKRLGALTDNKPKVLLELEEGLTFLDYHMCLLKHFAGLKSDDVVIVAGYNANAVMKFVHKYNIRVLINNFYNIYENMYSVYITYKLLEGADGYIILNGDTLVHPCILVGLIDAFYSSRNNDRVAMLAVDSIKKLGKEEMKVVIEKGKVKRLGKEIDTSIASGEYIGLSIFGSTAYKKFIESLSEHVTHGVTNVWYEMVLNSLVNKIEILPFYIGSMPWIEVDTADDYMISINLFKNIFKKHIKRCYTSERDK